jgi:hypothetical protein
MRISAASSFSSIRRTLTLMLLGLACACGTTRLTPQQEWVMTKFAECETLTNAINVRLDQVYPDGRWTATVMQTQSEFNRLEACMQDEAVTASLCRRQADGGDGVRTRPHPGPRRSGALVSDGRRVEVHAGGRALEDHRRVGSVRQPDP